MSVSRSIATRTGDDGTTSLLYGQLATHSEGERKLFPGAVPIALFIVALLLTRRRDGGQAPSPVRTWTGWAPVLHLRSQRELGVPRNDLSLIDVAD